MVLVGAWYRPCRVLGMEQGGHGQTDAPSSWCMALQAISHDGQDKSQDPMPFTMVALFLGTDSSSSAEHGQQRIPTRLSMRSEIHVLQESSRCLFTLLDLSGSTPSC